MLAGLATEIPLKQSELAKMSMEIRGLRVPLVEPQPPPVSYAEVVTSIVLCFFSILSYRIAWQRSLLHL